MSDQDSMKIEDSVLRLVELAQSRHGSISEPDGYISPALVTLDAVVLTSIQTGRELKEQ